MSEVVLLRHGESTWNLENRFTGWHDVPLSDNGIKEAIRAGQILSEAQFQFDVAYTSYLKRAIQTLQLTLRSLDQLWLPIDKSWRLNERHYGALQGLNKSETAQKYGEDQVLLWRRSYDVLPPLMDEDSPEHACHDIRYAHIPRNQIPSAESLAVTVQRVIPYWTDVIWPQVILGRKVLIVAHGNSLRALLQYLHGYSPEEILKINIPTAQPIQIKLDQNGNVQEESYLGDQESIQKAMEAVASQGKK